MILGAAASISVMDDRIDFFCARAEHQGSEPNDDLTMHEDRWAYCAAGARAPHDWHAMPGGGMSLEDAKQFVRRQRIHQANRMSQRSD